MLNNLRRRIWYFPKTLGNLPGEMSSMAKSMDYPSLIRDEIAKWESEQNLRVSQISDKCAIRDARGKGSATCYKCKNRWTTVYAQVTINFKQPNTLKRYGQKCKRCDTLRKLHISEESFREITQHAIESMVRCHTGVRKNTPPGPVKKTPPHLCLLCEKCHFGEHTDGYCCVGQEPGKGKGKGKGRKSTPSVFPF